MNFDFKSYLVSDLYELVVGPDAVLHRDDLAAGGNEGRGRDVLREGDVEDVLLAVVHLPRLGQEDEVADVDARALVVVVVGAGGDAGGAAGGVLSPRRTGGAGRVREVPHAGAGEGRAGVLEPNIPFVGDPGGGLARGLVRQDRTERSWRSKIIFKYNTNVSKKKYLHSTQTSVMEAGLKLSEAPTQADWTVSCVKSEGNFIPNLQW